MDNILVLKLIIIALILAVAFLIWRFLVLCQGVDDNTSDLTKIKMQIELLERDIQRLYLVINDYECARNRSEDEKPIEVTMAEVEEKFGCEVKIVKEEEND